MNNDQKPTVNNENTWETNGFYLAVYLMTVGERLLRVRQESVRTRMMVFDKSAELLAKVDLYRFANPNDPSVLVDPRDWENNLRKLKSIVSE